MSQSRHPDHPDPPQCNDFRIQMADDWAIDRRSFLSLTAGASISVDLFAHMTNKKHDRFFSLGLFPGSAGLDAFAQSWLQENAWCCPPVSLIIPAIRKICSTRMTANLVVPVWRSAAFWPFLFPDGRTAIQQRWKITLFCPHVIRGQFCYNPLLQGRTAFPFLALFLTSAGFGYHPRSGLISCPSLL